MALNALALIGQRSQVRRVEDMTASELKAHVDATGSKFFNRDTMRFFGDTMRNYGVREAMVQTYTDKAPVAVWELYRRRAVKHGLQSSAYFRKDGYGRTWPRPEQVTECEPVSEERAAIKTFVDGFVAELDRPSKRGAK